MAIVRSRGEDKLAVIEVSVCLRKRRKQLIHGASSLNRSNHGKARLSQRAARIEQRMNARGLQEISRKLNVQILDLAFAGELRGRARELVEVADIADEPDHRSLLNQILIHEQTPHRDLRLVEVTARDPLQDRHSADGVGRIRVNLEGESANLGEPENLLDCAAPEVRWSGEVCRAAHNQISVEGRVMELHAIGERYVVELGHHELCVRGEEVDEGWTGGFHTNGCQRSAIGVRPATGSFREEEQCVLAERRLLSQLGDRVIG